MTMNRSLTVRETDPMREVPEFSVGGDFMSFFKNNNNKSGTPETSNTDCCNIVQEFLNPIT